MSQVLVRYEDFVIRFGPGPGGSYAVDVDSPQGEGDGFFEIPESLRERAGHEISPGPGKPRDAIPRVRKLGPSEQQAGTDLFQALFQGEVLQLFRASLASLSGKDHRLRINIELNPRRPKLAPLQDLPWERLCDPTTGDFLGLSLRTSVVRVLRAHRPRRPTLPRKASLRILVIAASPAGWGDLDIQRERQDLEKTVEIVFLPKADREELRRALRESIFHVLHFMGHGGFDKATGEGSLIFEKDGSGAFPVSGSALAKELKDYPELSLVVLNACHTARAVGVAGPTPFAGVATALVMEGVPMVVAMRRPILDETAVHFSRTFYDRWANEDPVDAAMVEARLAIHRLDERSEEWSTPVLFLRAAREEILTPRRIRLLIVFVAAVVILAILSSYLGLSREQDRRASTALRYSNQGIELLDAGRGEEAREAFLAALKIDPDYAVAYANLSVLEEDRGNYEEAVAHARAAVEAEPAEAVYHYNLGSLLARLGRNEEALESFREALRLKPGYGEACNELGNLYLDLDRPEDARRELEAGLRVAPDLAPLHKNLARVDLAEDRIDAAIHELETALGLYESGDRQGIAEALYWLATAHARAGRREEACRRLKEVRQEAGVGHWASEADRLAQQIPCRRVS